MSGLEPLRTEHRLSLFIVHLSISTSGQIHVDMGMVGEGAGPFELVQEAEINPREPC